MCLFFFQKSWLKLVSAVIINNIEDSYGVYFVLGTVLSALHILIYWIFSSTLWWRHCIYHPASYRWGNKEGKQITQGYTAGQFRSYDLWHLWNIVLKTSLAPAGPSPADWAPLGDAIFLLLSLTDHRTPRPSRSPFFFFLKKREN